MRKFIGDKKFYQLLFAIVMPIVLQQFITQFVSLLDNLMVGQVGSSEMTGVSLANQILFVFNLGSLSGASIFATQYFGAKDKKGYQETFRFKWLMGLVIFAITTIIVIIFNKQLINFFINFIITFPPFPCYIYMKSCIDKSVDHFLSIIISVIHFYQIIFIKN